MAKKRYYAVYKGRKTGIFNSWDECEAQVKGYGGAIYKGFATLKEATEWMVECSENDDMNQIPDRFIANYT